VVPNAVFDDGHLHLLVINSRWGEIMQNLANAFLNENKLGTYYRAHEIRITTPHERFAQIDGNLYRKGTCFDFRVLPKALQMWY
jgi:diacylglycerol kinase family enzyme